jgi:ABC-type sugar transport system ATPase subunit
VEQVGTYQDLTENPLSIFVAGFLGLSPMDFYPSGSVSDGRLVLGEYSFPLPYRTLSSVENGQQVTMGSRREAVHVSADASSTNGIQFSAEVESFESDFVHRVQLVFLRMGSLKFTGVCPIDVKLYVGQNVPIMIDPERLYFFDTRSGKRL